VHVDQDVVTGFANRPRFEEDLERQVERGRRYGERALLVVVGLDGEDALRASAVALRGCLRTSDVLGRLGGDELVAILPYATPDEADEVAEKVGAVVPRTASVGVAAIDGHASPGAVMDAAVHSMHAARRAGRRARPAAA
jgi:diguanylate cyclase (GGDEF)-like protein